MKSNLDLYYDEKLNSILDELEDMKIELSDEEEKALEEISRLKESIKDHDLLKDFGDAALQGVQDYLNSFIDTSEIVDDLKNPSAIRARNNTDVKFRTHSVNPDNPNPTRTLEASKISPYSANAKRDNSGMSEKGRRKLAYYEEAYKQRTKTMSNHTNDMNGDLSRNDIAMAGVESFQFGPKVPLYSSEEYKTMYEKAGQPINTEHFIREKNYDKFDSETYKEFGFSSKSQMTKWRKDNKLTIHETPSGMYLVPTDVHASESHRGEVSLLHKYLRGDMTKEQLNKAEHDVKIAKIKYETSTRVQRTGKAIKMGSAKILVQQFCSIVVTETYFEFKEKSENSFSDRIGNVVKNCGVKMKTQLMPTLMKLIDGAVGNIATEILTALNDFFCKTAKNIFKVIRAMIGSIIRALKVLFSKEYTWQEKVYEAMKILSAGLVAALGFSLNEVIKDALTNTGITPLMVIAPFAADVISGLLASLLSAFVLMLFDSYKDKIQMQNALAKMSLMQMQVTGYNICISHLEAVQATVYTAQTSQIVSSAAMNMAKDAEDIDENLLAIGEKLQNARREQCTIEDSLDRIKNGNAATSRILDEINNLISK